MAARASAAGSPRRALPAVFEAYFSTVAARGPVGVFYEHQFGHDGTDQASVLLKPGSMILDPQRASRYGRLTRPAQQTGSAPQFEAPRCCRRTFVDVFAIRLRPGRRYLYVSSGNRIRASEEYRSYSFNRLTGTSKICLTSGDRGLMIPLPSPSRNELNPCLGRHR